VSAARLAVVAAGGTGGHLFPAEALARALIARGWRIILASDERVAQHAGAFPAEDHIALSARTFRPGDPVGMALAALALAQGTLQARAAFARLKPDVVVGFGGYPSAPSILAAASLGVRTVIHEQNAVMGRANRFLAPFVTDVACAFPTLGKASAAVQAKAQVVGNPVRPDIRALYDRPYHPPGETGLIHLLVTGGSQGARLLSELTPAAIAALPEALRVRLKVWQQARPDSMDTARRIYGEALVDAEVAPFFRDMATRLGGAELVIGRSGSGTVNEIAIAGRPSILVPLAIALDDDQGQNALALGDGAVVIREADLTVQSMAQTLQSLLTDPARLVAMSLAARAVAKPDAAERLADVVEQTAARQLMTSA
jgi:UDP-N-acetylglucosamine--N-acetylmuramyl-(pentapeptide) pyrophosphoryl-undecaprenol N-acetylglucosamine transferase